MTLTHSHAPLFCPSQEAYDCEGSHVNVYEVIFSIKKCGSTIKAQLLRRDSFFNSTPCYDIEALVIAEGKLQIARQAKDHDLSVGDVLASLRASPRVARPMRIESSIPPHRKWKVLSRGFRLGRLVQSKR